MVRHFAGDDLETYLMTVMNMVAGLFRDHSIGAAINIVVVRMILLESPEDEFTSDDGSADSLLKSFCKWQHLRNTEDDSDPLHHDIAILVTRIDLCNQNVTCNTLGLAEVGSLCESASSCNINEDSGLTLAYTIAHEIAHNFGAEHDSKAEECFTDESAKHIMLTELTTTVFQDVWSPCSREKISAFLDQGLGKCLDDTPPGYLPIAVHPSSMPGLVYDVDHQCQLQYGKEASSCIHLAISNDPCEHLWCMVNDTCKGKMLSLAEGTSCGESKWCIAGKCVDIDESAITPVHGQWGEWGPWSECSRTCGGGVQHAVRFCDRPKPSKGGKFCSGSRRKNSICNTKDCLKGNPSFREVQCSAHNTPETSDWTPHFSTETLGKECKLICKSIAKSIAEEKSPLVADGTPCNPETNDICIHGICEKVGCDWKLNSKAHLDSCLICITEEGQGFANTCETFSGTWNADFRNSPLTSYRTIIQIPKHATSIQIKETHPSENFLAIKSAFRGTFCLNGDWFIRWPGEYEVADSVANYQREDLTEEISITGPINESIIFMVLTQEDETKIEWKYSLKASSFLVSHKILPEKAEESFEWHLSGWKTCSSTCGGGQQEQDHICILNSPEGHVRVPEENCDHLSKPDIQTRECGMQNCPIRFRWWTGPWQDCSVTCGIGLRKRTIMCLQSNFMGISFIDELPDWSYLIPVEMELCHQHVTEDEEPVSEETCVLMDCPSPSGFSVGVWSETCTGDPCDVQTREVTCTRKSPPCDEQEKPLESRTCGEIQCGSWEIDEWSRCSTTCGEGLQFRHVFCSSHPCHAASKPKAFRLCNSGDESACYTETEGRGSGSGPTTTARYNLDFAEHGSSASATNSPPEENGSGFRPENSINTQLIGTESSSDFMDYNLIAEEDLVVDLDLITGLIQPVFKWKLGTWSQCSLLCDGGLQTRSIKCQESITGVFVDLDLCTSESPKKEQTCNEEACEDWSVDEWSDCDQLCGPGLEHRTVSCPVKPCNPSSRPKAIRPCFGYEC